MDRFNHLAQRMEANRAELVERIMQILPADWHAQPLDRLHLHSSSQVLEASPERLYLSFRLELDPGLVSSVMAEI